VAIVVPTPNTTITSAWGKSVADAINGAIPRELAYAQVTASKTVTATAENVADLVVAAPALTFDGTIAVNIEVFTPAAVPAPAVGAALHLWLYQDGVSIGRLAALTNPAAASFACPVTASRRLVPTAGSQTFSFAATAPAGGNGNIAAGTGGAGQYMPAYIRITRAA